MKTTRVTERYVINGKEYSSLDEIPEAERKLLDQPFKMFEDKDGDGVPDLIQDLASGRRSETKVVRTFSSTVDTADAAKDANLKGETLQRFLESMGNGPRLPDQRKEARPPAPRVLHAANTVLYAVIAALLAVIAYLLLER